MRKLPLLLALLILAQLLPNLSHIEEAAAILPTSTGAVGKGTSVYGQLISFTTAETAVQTDLNGDGDTYDTVIQYYDVSSGTITNTGVEAAEFSLSMFGNIIVFTTPTGIVRFYNLASTAVFDTGLSGESPRIWGNLIVYAGLDQRIRTYNILTGLVEETGALGALPSMYGSIVGFSTSESLVQADLNGDGLIDPFTSVVRYYDRTTGRTTNTGAVGDRTSTYGSIIVFDYALNAPIRFYDIASGVVTDTGFAGFSPAVYGDNIFFENGTIRMYQVSTGTRDDTRIDGTSPSAYKNLVAFETDENVANKDLNGDHLVKDVVIQYVELPLRDVAVNSLEASSQIITGPTMDLWVSAANVGDVRESVSLVVFWNSTIITSVGVTLDPQTSTMVSVPWSTGDLSPGSYVLSARTSVIPGEAETVNNLFVDGTLVKASEPPPSGAGGGGGGCGGRFDVECAV